MKLVYQPTYNLDEAMAVFNRETKKDEMMGATDNDSVEGIMFSREEAVIMTGTFTDECEPDKLNRMGLWFKPWFYTVMPMIFIWCIPVTICFMSWLSFTNTACEDVPEEGSHRGVHPHPGLLLPAQQALLLAHGCLGPIWKLGPLQVLPLSSSTRLAP